MLQPSAPPHSSARSPPLKWLIPKINSVVSNKPFFLIVPLSLSPGDRFLLVAISFHNTEEEWMHYVKDVKKINALSNAKILGRLIIKIQLPDWRFCRMETIHLRPYIWMMCPHLGLQKGSGLAVVRLVYVLHILLPLGKIKTADTLKPFILNNIFTAKCNFFLPLKVPTYIIATPNREQVPNRWRYNVQHLYFCFQFFA